MAGLARHEHVLGRRCRHRRLHDRPAIRRGNAIPWVLLDRAGVQAGPTGDRLTKTTHVQRVNTHGGVAPSTGCSGLADVGTKAIVPYTADYVFYFNPTLDRN